MDELNVIWEYEIEGFKNDDGDCYLPDFFLPKLDCLLEVKPRKPTDDEYEKCWIAVEATGKDLFVLWGEPQDPKNTENEQLGCRGLFRNNRCPIDSGFFEEWVFSDERYWAHCTACGATGLVFSGATEKLRCCAKNPGHSLVADACGSIAEAAEKARNFRFGKIA